MEGDLEEEIDPGKERGELVMEGEEDIGLDIGVE